MIKSHIGRDFTLNEVILTMLTSTTTDKVSGFSGVENTNHRLSISKYMYDKDIMDTDINDVTLPIIESLLPDIMSRCSLHCNGVINLHSKDGIVELNKILR